MLTVWGDLMRDLADLAVDLAVVRMEGVLLEGVGYCGWMAHLLWRRCAVLDV